MTVGWSTSADQIWKWTLVAASPERDTAARTHYAARSRSVRVWKRARWMRVREYAKRTQTVNLRGRPTAWALVRRCLVRWTRAASRNLSLAHSERPSTPAGRRVWAPIYYTNHTACNVYTYTIKRTGRNARGPRNISAYHLNMRAAQAAFSTAGLGLNGPGATIGLWNMTWTCSLIASFKTRRPIEKFARLRHREVLFHHKS